MSEQDTIDILIRSAFDASGSSQAVAALQQLQAASKGVAASPVAASATQTTNALMRTEKQALATAQAYARLQKAQGDTAGAVQTLENALASATSIELRQSYAVQTQITMLESGKDAFQQFGAGAVQSLSSIVGPAALASAAIGGVIAVARSFGDALKFKADLDATTAAINIQLKGVRDVGETWASASTYANKYKLTQQQVNEAIVAAMPVIRNSKASMEDILGTFDRLKMRDPAKTFSDAARALGELQAGQTMSLVRLFNVPLEDANKMKHEIEGGADAVRVLSQYLNDTGLNMDALKAKTEGVKGAMLDAEKAQERLRLAQAKWAEGPGLTVLQAKTTGLLSLTEQLQGNFQGVDDANRVFIDTLMQTGSVSEALTARNEALSGATQQVATADTQATAAAQQLAAAHMVAADADDRRAAAAATAAQVTQAEADASLLDKAAKETQTAQTELLNFQTRQAAASFMVLNPNITAAGAASAYAAGQISMAVNAYIQTTLATARARIELANLQAQAGVSPALKAAATAAGGGDVGRYITRTDLSSAEEGKANAARVKQLEQQEQERKAAQQSLDLARATSSQKVAIRQKEYDDAARIYGKGSTQALKAETDLVQAQSAAEKAGHKGRADAATQGADRLATIEQNAGNKLADIDRKTQDKLIAIDKKAAEERMAAWRKLNEAIETSEADRRARDEADDLELIGVKDKNKAKELNNRERAEAKARTSEQAAAAEARATAESGDAETAGKVYDIHEKQIDQQQALDEKYYARQAELAGNPKALEALQTQYDEATRAIQEAADTRVAIEQNAAEQRKAAAQAEKDAVIAAAEEEKSVVLGKAVQMADGVKKATGEARDVAVSNLKAVGDGVNNLPSYKKITIDVVTTGSGASTAAGESSSGGTKAAGGGSFMTHGPTTLTVGDNPGGVEAVSVVPISGRGHTSVGGGMARLAGGGVVVIDAGNGYTTPIAGTGGGGGGGAAGKAGAAATVDLKKQLDEQKNVVQLLSDLIKLRGELEAAAGQQPFDIGLIKGLAKRAAEFVQIVQSNLIPITKNDGEALNRYADAARNAIGLLKDVADLRHALQENIGDQPFDIGLIKGLAKRASDFTQFVRANLIPLTEFEAEQLKRYQDAVGSSISLFKDAAGLSGKMFDDYTSPTDAQITMIVRDANRVAKGVAAAAKVYSKDGLEGAKAFSDAVGGTFSAFKDGLLFFDALKSGDFTLNPADLAKFEKATSMTLDVTKRLGAQAAAIPAGNITALQTTTAALAAQSEALIKLAAVPFGDIVSGAQGLNRSGGALLGGAGGTTNIYNTFNLPAGSNQQTAAYVIQQLSNQVNTRRT